VLRLYFSKKEMSAPLRSSIYNPPDGSLDDEELINSEPDTIAQQLASRLAKEKLFTKIGGRFMISLRPSRGSSVDSLSKEYARKAKDSASAKHPLPAHVFNIATSAYIHAQRTTMDQSIVLMYFFV
jgi:myosin heavy subunit